jgi:hypothetical protein
MLILGPSYTPNWENRPAGMSKEDWPVWMCWLWHGEFHDEVYFYNVRLGQSHEPPATAPENYARMWRLNGCYRIDALGVTQPVINIYEIKTVAGPHELWQINFYRDLLRQELRLPQEIQAWLLAEEMLPGTAAQARALEIGVWCMKGEC